MAGSCNDQLALIGGWWMRFISVPSHGSSLCRVSRALTFALCPLSPTGAQMVPISARFQAPSFDTSLSLCLLIALEQQTHSRVRVSVNSSECSQPGYPRFSDQISLFREVMAHNEVPAAPSHHRTGAQTHHHLHPFPLQLESATM